jgi:hypothetical protein
MHYVLLIYDQEKQWETLSEAEMAQVMAEFGAYTEGLVASKRLVLGHQLQPTATATSLRAKGGKLETVDGPFAETKEQLGGFYIIEAGDLDEALAIAAKCPGTRFGTVEVRPVVPDPA